MVQMYTYIGQILKTGITARASGSKIDKPPLCNTQLHLAVVSVGGQVMGLVPYPVGPPKRIRLIVIFVRV